MKRVLKSFCTIGLALPVVFSLMGITSFAAGGGSKLECDILEEGQADVIAEQLEKCITNKYQGYYTFDNFRPTFYNEQYADGIYMVDVDISVDKTLVRDPEESAIARGMKQEVEAQIQARQRDTAQAVLDEYLSNTSKYFNVPIETGFEFRVYITALTEEEVNNATDFEHFYRVDAEDGPILTPVIENEPFVELGTEEDGKARLASEMSAVESRAVSYDADAAVKYAIDNVTATPEFSSANGLGSDCANFVSKCINAGGIPIDNAGKWYPAPKKGSYASENWMRTGYNNNGGVKTYMTDKGYFDSTTADSVATGDFVYWNSRSHVALVTRYDGYTIEYSQHSSSKQDKVYHMLTDPKTVTLYKPTV